MFIPNTSKNSKLSKIISDHVCEGSRDRQDETLNKCIELFSNHASSNILTDLEEKLKEDEKHHDNYIKNFLPELKKKVMQSQLDQAKKTKIEKVIRELITLDAVSKSSDKDHPSSTIQNQNGRRNNQINKNAVGLLKNKSFSNEVAIAESSGSSPLERDSLAKGVSGKGTPGKYNILRDSIRYDASLPPTLEQSQLNGSFSQSCEDLENEDPSTTADAAEMPSDANTSKLSGGNDSDSGIDSPRKSEESSRSPVSSRRSSISSTEENNNSQKGDTGNQIQQEQDALEEPQVQESGNSSDQRDQVKNGVSPGVIQVADTEIQREKNMNPDGQATQMTGSQAKDSMQPEEKRDRKNAITIVQKFPLNKKKGEDTPPEKQPNNRNLHVALVAGCALSTIGCIVAGAMTSGLVGAGLLAMAAVFAIAAVAELHSNFLSSKLTSISVEPHVNDKGLTAL